MLAKEAVIVRDALDPSISESAQRVRAALEEKGLETLYIPRCFIFYTAFKGLLKAQ